MHFCGGPRIEVAQSAGQRWKRCPGKRAGRSTDLLGGNLWQIDE